MAKVHLSLCPCNFLKHKYLQGLSPWNDATSATSVALEEILPRVFPFLLKAGSIMGFYTVPTFLALTKYGLLLSGTNALAGNKSNFSSICFSIYIHFFRENTTFPFESKKIKGFQGMSVSSISFHPYYRSLPRF